MQDRTAQSDVFCETQYTKPRNIMIDSILGLTLTKQTMSVSKMAGNIDHVLLYDVGYSVNQIGSSLLKSHLLGF